MEFLDAAEARELLIALAGSFGGTALMVALFVVASTFALLVQQRAREIALLRAVAATPRQVRRMIYREAQVVAVAAGILGAIPAVALAGWLREQFVARGLLPGNLHAAGEPAAGAGRAGGRAGHRVAGGLGRGAARLQPRPRRSARPRWSGWAVAGSSPASPSWCSAPGCWCCRPAPRRGSRGQRRRCRRPARHRRGAAEPDPRPHLRQGPERTAQRLSRTTGYLAVANTRANSRRLGAAITP